MKRVHIVSGNAHYHRLMSHLGYEMSGLEDADLILFTGGEDVSPKMYGHKKHATTYNNIGRDLHETVIAEYAVDNGIPAVGICRGGQFLNVFCGGTMYQHIETGNHAIGGTHPVLFEGVEYECSSTHHQMMIAGEKGEVIGIAPFFSECTRWSDHVWRTDMVPYGTEVVLYEEENVLCFQPHPEFFVAHPCIDLFVQCLNKLEGVDV